MNEMKMYEKSARTFEELLLNIECIARGADNELEDVANKLCGQRPPVDSPDRIRQNDPLGIMGRMEGLEITLDDLCNRIIRLNHIIGWPIDDHADEDKVCEERPIQHGFRKLVR